MRFGIDVAFKAVFISALLFARLAVEFELLKPFALHFVGNVLWRHEFCFRHLDLLFAVT